MRLLLALLLCLPAFADFNQTSGAIEKASNITNGIHTPIVHTDESDFDIARGLVPGISNERKFGDNDNIGTSSVGIWPVNTVYNFLTTADTIRIKAGGTLEDDQSGTGARSIMIEGLDETWVEASEILLPHVDTGSSVGVTSTTTFIRVNRAWVIDSGTYSGTNIGDITIETTGGTTIAIIVATKGQTEQPFFTTPLGKSAYLEHISIFVEDGKDATVNLFKRENADDTTTPFTAPRIITEVHDLKGTYYENLHNEVVLEKSDVYVMAFTSTGTTAVSTIIHYKLVTN